MTQHINLITRHRAKRNMALFAMFSLGTLIVICILWAVIAEVRLHQLALTTQDVQQTVAVLRAELQKKRHEAGLEDVQALARDSAEMQRVMDEHRALMQLVQKGEIGSMQGHAIALQTLATLPQSGVWLQGVDVTKAGQAMRISGTALTSAAIIQYAAQLNQSFKPMGTEFTSLEISKEEWTESVAPDAPKVSVLKFKLY